MGVSEQLLIRRRGLMSFKPNLNDPKVLQRIAASGRAKSYYSTGDEIIIPWTDHNASYTYQYPFIVVHIGDCYDDDNVLHHNAIWLQTKYCAPNNFAFDALEDTTVDLSTEPNALEGWHYWGLTGTTYTALNLSTGDSIPTTYDSIHKCGINHLNVLKYGYNRWKDSAIRQWLNSDVAPNVGWWTAQHLGDLPVTSSMVQRAGWLYGFAQEWRSIFKPVKVQTAVSTEFASDTVDTTYDRFFIPSLEQVYGVPQAAGVEGEYWEYWKEATGLTSPSNGTSSNTNDARKIPRIDNPSGGGAGCRLRSAGYNDAWSTWKIYGQGYIFGDTVRENSYYISACVIY